MDAGHWTVDTDRRQMYKRGRVEKSLWKTGGKLDTRTEVQDEGREEKVKI